MDILYETIVIPIWIAAVVVAVAVVTLLIRTIDVRRPVAAAIGIAALLTAVAIPLLYRATANRPAQQTVASGAGDPAVERRALEARRADLAARAATPGSSLACLDALAGELVESACEQTVFASSLSVAVAVSYAAARLRLLADGVAFATRADPDYAASLADLRLSAENDAYGIYAHVLATRDGCQPEQCAAFTLLRDVSTLKVHLRQRLYATYVAQHRDRWGSRPAPPAVAPVASLPEPPAPAVAPPDAAPAVSTATAPVESAPALAVAATPIPKARPTIIDTARAAPDTSATAPASVEDRLAAATVSSTRARVPPVASVLPNIDFPSASSIPPISIMAAEPKLPTADTAPAAPSTAPKGSSRPQ